jgi:acyl-coenzyme A thioesterase PaaI-like protein
MTLSDDYVQQETHNRLHRTWRRLSALPGGKVLFSVALGLYIPYTGSMRSRVEELRPGYARVRLRDRRRVRNHLDSIHAVAIANLAEFTGNLAMVCGLPDHARFIVKGLTVQYLKKGRGTLIGESQTEVIETSDRREVDIRVTVRDAGGETVAIAVLSSLVGPRKRD